MKAQRRGTSLLALLLGLSAAQGYAAPCEVRVSTRAKALAVAMQPAATLLNELETRARTGLPVALQHDVTLGATHVVFGCRITFDPWDDKYTVVASGPGGALTQTLAKVSPLPPTCISTKIVWNNAAPTNAASVTTLDPVDEAQMERTRTWLAERGIGKDSNALVGRAVAAMVDLKAAQKTTAPCTVSTTP